MTATPHSSSLLDNRWWYLGLTLAVFLCHRWTMASYPGRSLKLRPSTSMSERAPGSKPPVWERSWDAERAKQVLASQPQLGVWLTFWTLLAAALGLGGAALSLQAISQGALGRLFAYPSKISLQWSWGEVGRIVWLMLLIAGLLPLAHVRLAQAGLLPLPEDRIWTVVMMGLLDTLVVLIIWAFVSNKLHSPSTLLGPSGAARGRAVRESLTIYVTCFPWMFGLLWLVLSLAGAAGLQPEMEPIHELLFIEERRATLALTAVLACVVGPVAEELLFRGVIFGALRRSTSRWVAILASSALFAALHTNLIGFVPILALGCLLAVLYERSGSLLGPIAVHIVHNTFLVGLGLTARDLLS